MAEDPIDKFLEELRHCPICCDSMEQPKKLLCGHAFCLNCLKGYIGSQARQQGRRITDIVCAMCREPTKVPVNGLERLPTYCEAENARDALDKAGKAGIVRSGQPRCNNHYKALNVWCTTCKKLICDVCRSGNNEHTCHSTLTVNEGTEKVNQLFEDSIKNNAEYKSQIDKINQYKNTLMKQKDDAVKMAKRKAEEEYEKRVRDIERNAEVIEKRRLGQLDDTLKKFQVAYDSGKNTTETFQRSRPTGNVEQQLLYLGLFKPNEKHNLQIQAAKITHFLNQQANPFANLSQLASIAQEMSTETISGPKPSMIEEMRSFCVTAIQNAFKHSLPKRRAMSIVRQMNDRYGNSWNCFIGSKEASELSHGFDPDYMFQSNVEGSLVIICKTNSVDGKCFPNGTISQPGIVSKCDNVDNVTRLKVLNAISECIRNGVRTRDDIAKWMMKAFDVKSGKQVNKSNKIEAWQCVVTGGHIAMQTHSSFTKHSPRRSGTNFVIYGLKR